MQPENLGPLAAALAKAQAEFPAIPRDRKVTVRMKSGGTYDFSYAPLDTIIAAVRPALAKNGLAFAQLLDDGGLVTLLIHESGAVLEGRVTIPPTANVQDLGSAITYLRRYALQAMLGIASEEDDDGNRAVGNQATARHVDRATGEITSRPAPAPVQAVVAPPAPSQADVANLHADARSLAARVFSPEELEGIAPTGGMTASELFKAAESAEIPKAILTLTAKNLFGATRWKVTDLSDEERAQLWEEVSAVPA